MGSGRLLSMTDDGSKMQEIMAVLEVEIRLFEDKTA
jgi:hypothetical protein